jgi:hypothetical protein
LLALNPLDRRELWRAPMPEYNMTYVTPVHGKEGDRGFAGMMCVSRFTAFRVTDGSLAWWVDG